MEAAHISTVAQILVVLAVLAAVHVPLGNHIARVYTSATHWRVEHAIYRIAGIDADADQPWPAYLRSLLSFSAVGIGLLYLLLRVQDHLPYSVGAGRRRGLTVLMRASVSRYCLAHARCPALLVPGPTRPRLQAGSITARPHIAPGLDRRRRVGGVLDFRLSAG